MSHSKLQDFLNHNSVRHFTASEVAKLAIPPEELWARILPTIRVAERLRATLNKEESGAYIVVTSGYRDKEHNRRVGGAANSLHTHFNALDIVPMRGQEPISLEHCRKFLEDDFVSSFMGIGIYRTFIHIDTRGLFSPNGGGARF